MTVLLNGLLGMTLVLVGYLYWQAFRRCRMGRRGPISPSRLAGFGLGMAMVAAALLSPLEAAAEQSLAAHMLQHVLLLIAPLPFLAARTGTAMLLGVDRALRARVAGIFRGLEGRLSVLWRRPVAWGVLAATLAVWHIPALFEAAAVSPLLHAAEHLMFVAAAGVWWLSLLGTGTTRSARYGESLLSVFGTMLIGTAVGALLTFSTQPWYPLYAARVEAAGGDWLVDQQLAGLLMWIPPGMVLLGVFAWLASAWLRAVDSGRNRGRLTT